MPKFLLALAMLTTPAVVAAPILPVDLPPASAGARISFDVHEGTSMAVSISPDGRTLAIDLQGSLWTLPAKGGRAQRISDLFSDARQPAWSPDGKRLAFFSYREGNYDLFTVAPDGSDLRHVTSGAPDDRDPAWSPDGRTLAFASDRAGVGAAAYHIWTADLASGAVRQVTTGTGEDRMPTWSPDGREIAYSSLRSAVTGLYATAAAGGRRRAGAAAGRRQV